MKSVKKILFVDDQLDVWESFLKEGLKEFGFDLHGETDPEKALQAISTLKPDAVLLDILFPGGQHLGKPTLKKIKDQYPDLPVVMITTTMELPEFNPDDYRIADYRYSKDALEDGDCSDLANQLHRIIQNAGRHKKGQDIETDMQRFGFVVGVTEEMQNIIKKIEKVAGQDFSILITGESGTGKELAAKALHKLSTRCRQKFVPINCAAIPKDLFESELFGHEKGAFTGAAFQKKGKFEDADDGTIFLDEIGELPFDIQGKLLRFLQDGQFNRLGGNEVISSRARIVSATNRNLQVLVNDNRFRGDLYHRLNTITIHLPPLRERLDDLPLFFNLFVEKANQLSHKHVLTKLREDVKKLLANYDWPYNIRELENKIYQAVAFEEESILQVNNFPDLNMKSFSLKESVSLDPESIAGQIIDGVMSWDDLKKLGTGEYGKNLRKKIFLTLLEKMKTLKNRRPSTAEIAAALSTTPSNLRGILSSLGIKTRTSV